MLKRLFDIFIAISGLIFFSPLLLLVAALIKLDSKGPILFKQERVGRFGTPFKIYKFRTMHINSENKGQLTAGANDTRITKVGRFIRRSHLDELIQLLNVLIGDMSIVGPRPEILKYTKHYQKDWDYILQVKPGITGIAAIKYADQEYKLLAVCKDQDKTYIKQVLPKKLKYEKFYVKRQNLCLDIKIILLTAKRLFS